MRSVRLGWVGFGAIEFILFYFGGGGGLGLFLILVRVCVFLDINCPKYEIFDTRLGAGCDGWLSLALQMHKAIDKGSLNKE